MNRTRKGDNFEREIAKIFRDAGFSVIRGARSHGQFGDWDADVIVTKETGQNRYEVGIKFGVAVMQMKVNKLQRKVKAAGLQ